MILIPCFVAGCAGAGGEDIVTLDDGFAQVKKNGIDPFISLVETNEREFFKAKDFVALYEYCALPPMILARMSSPLGC